MKRFSHVGAAAMVAMMAWGCGSDSNTAGTQTPTNDGKGTAADADATADTVTATDTAIAADTAKADTKPEDTAPVDTTPVDTNPPKKQKCSSTDNMCVNNCALKACDQQIQACGADPNCSKAGVCLTDCGKTPPVPLSAESTATCSQQCYDTYTPEGVAKTLAQNFCATSQCVLGNYKTPCAANDQFCLYYCWMDLCDKEWLECSKKPACVANFACAAVLCAGVSNSQECIADCSAAVTAKYGQAAAQEAGLSANALALCNQNKCQ